MSRIGIEPRRCENELLDVKAETRPNAKSILSVFLRILGSGILLAPCVSAQLSSSITLTSGQNPSLYGQAVSLTATVTPGATGKVTFYDGATILGTRVLTAGSARFTTVLLPSGTGYLQARYLGDATHKPSESAVVVQAVIAQPSTGLEPPVPYNAGAYSASMVVGDFNGDGYADILIPGQMFLGNGDGTFRASMLPNIGFAAVIALGDFNEDGKQDLAFVGSGGSDVEIALGNGDGTFLTPVSYRVTNEGTKGIAVADLNGDGHADLVIGLGPFGVITALGNGDGTFGTPATYADANADTIVAGDFDGDGNPDLVTGGANDFNLYFLRGNGDGTFQPVATIAPTLGYTNLVVAADFNGDGQQDLGLAIYGEVEVYVGNGNGTFQAPRAYITAAKLDNLKGIAAGDINGDGNADLILSDFGNTSVSVWLGNGDGSLQSPVTYPTSAYDPTYVVVGDFNGDGKTDAATVMETSGQMDVLIGGIPIIDLSVSVESGPGFTQGQVGAAYTILVANAGQLGTAGAVSVTDTLPVGFLATGISGTGWTCNLGALSCSRSDTLAPRTYYPAITVTANIPENASGTVTDTTSVSGGGDQNPANNTASSANTIRPAPSVSLNSSPNPSLLGQTIMLTASVSPAVSGEVTFYDGANVLGSAAVVNGQAVLSTDLLPSGPAKLSAVYGANSTYGPAYSAALLQTVNAMADNGFVPYSRYAVDTAPQYLATGDFNGDGVPDLVTANTGSSTQNGYGQHFAGQWRRNISERGQLSGGTRSGRGSGCGF